MSQTVYEPTRISRGDPRAEGSLALMVGAATEWWLAHMHLNGVIYSRKVHGAGSRIKGFRTRLGELIIEQRQTFMGDRSWVMINGDPSQHPFLRDAATIAGLFSAQWPGSAAMWIQVKNGVGSVDAYSPAEGHERIYSRRISDSSLLLTR